MMILDTARQSKDVALVSGEINNLFLDQTVDQKCDHDSVIVAALFDIISNTTKPFNIEQLTYSKITVSIGSCCFPR